MAVVVDVEGGPVAAAAVTVAEAEEGEDTRWYVSTSTGEFLTRFRWPGCIRGGA